MYNILLRVHGSTPIVTMDAASSPPLQAKQDLAQLSIPSKKCRQSCKDLKNEEGKEMCFNATNQKQYIYGGILYLL